MKCLILAAGYATRLYPLTENFPKPLLKVREKTILDWLLDDIEGSGLVDGFVVVSNHKFSHHFEEWAAGRNSAEGAVPVSVVDDGTSTNETRLGAVRDIRFAIDSLGIDDEMLVIAGDNVLNFSLVRFAEYSMSKGTSCIMRYYEPSEARLHKCGVVEVNDEDLVLSMEEKPEQPKSHWCCPPFYFLTRDDVSMVARGIESGCSTDAPGGYIAWLSSRRKVHAMEMPGKRFDIGNLESYNAVCNDYQGITIR
jgi:dTDP-glucose pyrophosphorylase